MDAFLRLTVTPQITSEGTIFLNVDVENTLPDFSQEISGNPTLITQQATTQVLVTDGGTVVIGGVIQTNNSLNVQQVPVLGDIPYLGNLFKHRSVSDFDAGADLLHHSAHRSDLAQRLRPEPALENSKAALERGGFVLLGPPLCCCAQAATLRLMDYAARLRSLQLVLPANKLDFLLVTHLPNIRYLSGFTGSAAALLVGGGGATLFTDGRYIAQAKEEVQKRADRDRQQGSGAGGRGMADGALQG